MYIFCEGNYDGLYCICHLGLKPPTVIIKREWLGDSGTLLMTFYPF